MRLSKALSEEKGFTLIELSVVLVIIGLIIGGILTGRDLINAATIRAQISQMEKYNTAVNTFRTKYGYLPGDIPNPYATNFGFQPRGALLGQGDGNGVLEGNCANSAGNNTGINQGCGEIAVFWEDISEAGLIDATIKGNDTGGSCYPHITTYDCGVTSITNPSISQWLPGAKLGNGNSIYIYSLNSVNYFAIGAINSIGWAMQENTQPGLTVQQAYNIDTKTDDGLPQSGNITACYINYSVSSSFSAIYAAGGGLAGATGGNFPNFCIPLTTATLPAGTDCFGNNNVTGTMTYSIKQNANVPNCALSFKFQ